MRRELNEDFVETALDGIHAVGMVLGYIVLMTFWAIGRVVRLVKGV